MNTRAKQARALAASKSEGYTPEDKFARRILRRAAFRVNNAPINRKLAQLAALKLTTQRAADNSHNFARVFAAELADRRITRYHENTSPGRPEARTDYRARTVPGRGARNRRIAKLYGGRS